LSVRLLFEFLSKARARCLAWRTLPVFLIFFCASASAPAQQENKKCEAPPALKQQLISHPSASAYDALGAYFGQQNDFSCAIPAFQSSLKIDPNSWKTRYYLGLALLTAGDAEHAAGELRISLRLNPDQPEARLTLGAALSQLNQTDAAIEQFKEVLKAEPESVTALDWLSKALLSQKRYAVAIALLESAPTDEVLRMELVIAYSESGNSGRALELLAQMGRDYPSSPTVHSARGMAYTRLHRYEDAASEFKEAFPM